jgi:hypothetical protein
MNDRWVRVLIAAAMVIALPLVLSAAPRPKSQPQMDPILDEEDQISPSQVLREAPATAKPSRPAATNRAAPTPPRRSESRPRG